MLRENLQILFILNILFISTTNSLHLNNRGGNGYSIGISNNIVGSSTSDNNNNNNIDDLTDDTHSYRRSQISSTSNLDYIDPSLNNRILIGEHYNKLPIGLGGGGGSISDGSPGSGNDDLTHKLFDDNFMKFNHIKSTNSSSLPIRHYNFGYIRNLDNIIPDINDDDIDIIDDNDYINNNYHHRPILFGLNQQQQSQQHYHPKHNNYQYGNIPIFNDELLLRNNELPPLINFNRKPPLPLSSSTSSSSSILHGVQQSSLPKYAMINGNRNRYEHDNYGYKFDDKIPKKYSNIKADDDLTDIDDDRKDNNNSNNNNDDDGMINDEPYDYRKRRINKKNKNNNQSPPKALQELFQQNGDSSVGGRGSSSSSSSSSSDSGKSGNNVNNRQVPLDIRIQSKQQTKMRQDQQQQKQQQRQNKKQLKQNENKQKKILQMEQLKQIKRSGNSGGGPPPQMMPPNSHSIASQLMLRTARGQRQYDVPQIECPSAMDGMERFACPTPDRQGRYRCIDDHVLCDGFIDCPEGEDEDRSSCMFYKTTKAHLDVLADALLRWARGR